MTLSEGIAQPPDADARPAVTVYMPAYNVARYVRQAVESILGQTFTDFEFIIINDGSKDDTLAVLEELARRDARIKLSSRENRGVAVTSNEAIAMARGEFIARMDGDDIAEPQRLEKQVAYLRAHPDVAVVGARVLLIDEAGLPLYEMPDVQFGHANIENALLSAGWPMPQAVCTFRRSAVQEVGGYRPDLFVHEDHDLFLRLAERWKLDNLPDTLVRYRQRLDSLTFTAGAAGRKLISEILLEARRRRGLPDLPTDQHKSPQGAAPYRNSMLNRCRHWSWMSLKARHLATARKYAWAGLRQAPLDTESWRLLVCTLRGW